LSPQKNNEHLSDGKCDQTYINEEVEIDSSNLSLEEMMLQTKHYKCSNALETTTLDVLLIYSYQFDNFI